MLTKLQFNILCEIEQADKKLTQREIAKRMDIAVGNVNKTIAFLHGNNYINDNMAITADGLAVLEPYKVKNAIFIAAGFGSRLVPITLNTPKPLVKVNGIRMIDTLLDAVIAVGITNIIIVRGYLGEQFDILLKKYPTISFIDNPIYNEANNISSAYFIKDKINNSYIFEADLVLYNPKLITKYQYNSNYLGVPVDKTDDWCFKYSNGKINEMLIGGTNCFHMFGISYWTEADGKKLATDIEKVIKMPGGKERFWDQVALEYCLNDYAVDIRQCTFKDIIEIDSFSDLKAVDKIYLL